MKKHKKYDLFEFPTNLGLKAPGSTEPGVRRLPEWLKNFGFYDSFEPDRVFRLTAPPYGMELDEESGVLNGRQVIAYAQAQADMLLDHWDGARLKLLLGGDCSILIGTALALSQKGRYGLFFLDGHTDFVFPHHSKTKAAAGMDLAIVTGSGHEKLTNLRKAQPFFKEENVFCVGNRNKEQAYLEPILASRIHYYSLSRLRLNGVPSVSALFLAMVRQHNLDGFFIHIDVDVLNDKIMPAVDSRQADGLTYEEFHLLLKPLMAHEKFIGTEITILDPDLDKNGIYTKDFVRNFTRLF